MKWINKEEFSADLSFEEINEQIKMRVELIKEMVGQLYPPILEDEILKLLDIKFKKRRG